MEAQKPLEFVKTPRTFGDGTSSRLHDYSVMKDGQWVATFRPKGCEKGYILHDITGRMIKSTIGGGLPKAVTCDSQAHFTVVFNKAVANGAIPTDIDLKARDALEKRQREERERINHEKHVQYLKWQAAEDMYEALKPFMALLQEHHKALPDQTPLFGVQDEKITVGDLRKAAKAFYKAEGVVDAEMEAA